MLGYEGPLEKFLNVGLIQTTVDDKIAWIPESINMSASTVESVWLEIKKGFRALKNNGDKPHLIILPELTLPHGRLNDLIKFSKATGAAVITGLDFEEVANRRVRNRAVIIVPTHWPKDQRSTNVSMFYFGKTFFSQYEDELFAKYTPSYSPYPDQAMYIVNAGPFGNIGVAICSDFFDIERFVIYKGRIHHMIVISHNQDTNSYYFLAEAIARLVFCNVIICNTGCYGGTLVFSPYRESFKRTIYCHEGADLFASQIIKLPVDDLDQAQDNGDINNLFKARPPGYVKIQV